MPWSDVHKKPWYRRPLVWAFILPAIGAGILAMPTLQRKFNRWRADRVIRHGQAAYDKGFYQEALLAGRSVLATSTTDVEANRLMAKSLEALGSPHALLFRRQIDATAPNDPENILGMAADSLLANDPGAATDALVKIPPADRDTARFHALAAGAAWAQNNRPLAELNWLRAIELAPNDDSIVLKLAEARLNGAGFQARREALATLTRLSTGSRQHLDALRLLLRDGLANHDAAQARDAADRLVRDPAATFSDKLARLPTLRLSDNSAFVAGSTGEEREKLFLTVLNQLRDEADSNAESLFRLLTWMNEHNLSPMVLEWEAQRRPREPLQKPPLCLAAAEALQRCSAWAELKERTQKPVWGSSDYLREAYLSRALERLGDPKAGAVAWDRGLGLASARPDCLETLSRLALSWSADEKAESALWRLAESASSPRWAADRLWETALRRQNTPQLYRASKLLLKAEPRSVAFRNNYISLALLTGETADAPEKMAETLFRENPQNITVASTYGLALFLHGKAAEAVAVLGKFPAGALHNPPIALYYGIFLAGAEDFVKAETYLQEGRKAPRLAEEKALSDYLLEAFESQALAQKGDTEHARAAWEEAVKDAARRTSSFETLAAMAQRWQRDADRDRLLLVLLKAEDCPTWAADALWAAALKTDDSNTIYKASQTISRGDAKNLTAKKRYVLLSLLTGQDTDAPDRQAEALYKQRPADAETAIAYALSTYSQGKADSALATLRDVKAEPALQPRLSLYRGIFLAANGQPAEAAAELARASPRDLPIPDERALRALLGGALDAQRLETAGDHPRALETWRQALTAAEARAEWRGRIVQMAQTWNTPALAQEGLWILAAAPGCPRWVVDAIWSTAEKSTDLELLGKSSRLLLKYDPKNLHVRAVSILVALLGNRGEESPHRLAESFKIENSFNPEAVSLYALSLYQRGRTRDALEALSRLKPEQLREGRPAFYYGLLLRAAGQPAQAAEYLRLAESANLLPEEKALLAQAGAVPAEPRAALTGKASSAE